MHGLRTLAAMALLAATAACTADTGGRTDSAVPAADSGAATAQAPAPQPLPEPDMKIEVNLATRELYVIKGGQRVATHKVAIGSTEWPTQTGEWKIVQAVWNPEWVPPDESWADEREPRKPGDPRNPLGVAQLVYDPPRSIHGTSDPTSIGKAVSHGSIRVTNEVAQQLAREAMEAGGAGKDEAWYTQAKANKTTKQIIDLPQPIPIRVY